MQRMMDGNKSLPGEIQKQQGKVARILSFQDSLSLGSIVAPPLNAKWFS